LDDLTAWNGFHGMWPATIVLALSRSLPPEYAAEPRVQVGTFEVDIAALESDEPRSVAAGVAAEAGEGGVATAAWAAPRPTLDVATDLPDQDVYEVRVLAGRRHRRLVAAIEIVSPANKDRPEHRRAFVAKCVALLQQGVSVTVVDVVTVRQFNLYHDLLELVGQADPSLGAEPPPVYAAACRWRCVESAVVGRRAAWRLQTWARPMAVGQPLPTLPLWLADDFAVPLELEATYEETCRVLRLP
jgi:hypothetical protein